MKKIDNETGNKFKIADTYNMKQNHERILIYKFSYVISRLCDIRCRKVLCILINITV